MTRQTRETTRRELAALFLLAVLTVPVIVALAWGRLSPARRSGAVPMPAPGEALAPGPSAAGSPVLEKADQEYLMRLLLDSIRALETSGAPPDTANAPEACRRGEDMTVVASVYRPGRERVRAMAREGSLAESVGSVARLLVKEPAFAQAGPDRSALLRARIDVVTQQQDLPAEQREELALLKPGEPIGLALWSAGEPYLFLPGDVAERRADDHMEMLRLLGRDAGLPAGKWREKTYPMSILKTLSFLNTEPGKADCLDVVRGLPLVREVGLAEVARSCRLAGRFLHGVQQADGLFPREYDAGAEIFLPGSDVQGQAQAAAALGRLCTWREDEQCLEACRNALGWLVRRSFVPKDRPDMAYILHSGKADEPAALEDAAAALRAFCEYRAASGDRTWDDLARRLGNFLVFLQRDDGLFASAYDSRTGAAMAGADPRWDIVSQSDAAQALALAHRELGEPLFVLSAWKALDVLSSQQVPPGAGPGSARFVTAVRELSASLSPDTCMARFEECLEAMFEQQLTAEDAPAPDMIGATLSGFPPPLEETAADLEAFVSGWLLAASRDDPAAAELREKSKSAALLAARYLVQFQFLPENSYYVGNPEAAEGGFRRCPGSNLVTLRSVWRSLDALSLLAQAMLAEYEEGK